MRTFFILTLILKISCLFSQNVDSIEYKLKKMKALADSGFITNDEYKQFKSSILLNSPFESSVSTSPNNNLSNQIGTTYKKNYIYYFSAGSTLIAGGVGIIGYATYFKNNKIPVYTPNTDLRTFYSQVQDYQTKYKQIYGIGGGVAGLGLIINLIGIPDIIKYKRLNAQITSNGTNVSILFTLK